MGAAGAMMMEPPGQRGLFPSGLSHLEATEKLLSGLYSFLPSPSYTDSRNGRTRKAAHLTLVCRNQTQEQRQYTCPHRKELENISGKVQ